jgi:hypothetical protein
VFPLFRSPLYIFSFEYATSGTVPRVKWGPSDHGIARPRVGDEGDGLQKWRVVAESQQRVDMQLGR